MHALILRESDVTLVVNACVLFITQTFSYQPRYCLFQLTLLPAITSVEAFMIYKYTVIAWSSVKKTFLITSLPLIHLLLSNRIRSIENRILDSLYLNNSVTACLLESSLDILVFFCIF